MTLGDLAANKRAPASLREHQQGMVISKRTIIYLLTITKQISIDNEVDYFRATSTNEAGNNHPCRE